MHDIVMVIHRHKHTFMNGITQSSPTSTLSDAAGAPSLADCMQRLGPNVDNTIVIVPTYAQQRYAVTAWAAAMGAGRPPMVMPMQTFVGHLADALFSELHVVADDEAQLLLEHAARDCGVRLGALGVDIRFLHRCGRYGIHAQNLADRPEYDEAETRTAHRLRRLERVWSAYRRRLGADSCDASDRQRLIAAALQKGVQATLFLRDHATPVRRLILRDVVWLSVTEIDILTALAADGWDIVVHWAAEPPWIDDAHGGEGSALRYTVHDVNLHDRTLESRSLLTLRGWHHVESTHAAASPRVAVRQFSTPSAEVRSMLAAVKVAVLRHGLRLSDIAIIVPDAAGYEAAIRSMARTMGVPLTGGEQVGVLTSAPASALLVACDVIVGGWRRSDLDRLRRCAIGNAAAAALHDVVAAGAALRIVGGEGADAWRAALQARCDTLERRVRTADDDAAGELRLVHAALQSVHDLMQILPGMSGPMSVHDVAERLEATMDALDLGVVAQETQRLAESYQRPCCDVEALQAVRETIRRYASVLATVQAAEETFVDHVAAFRSMLARVRVRLRDVRLEGVSLLRPADARGRQFDLVFSPGWTEGSFPSVPRYDRLEHDLLPYERQLDELDMAIDVVRAVAPGHGRLLLSHPSNVDDAEVLPSQFCALAVQHLAAWDGDPLLDIDAAAMVLSVDEHRLFTGGLRSDTQQRGLSASNATTLSSDNLAKHLERALSPTRLDAFGDCPYRYAAMHLLGLRDESRDDDTLSPLERGDMMHDIVRAFFLRLRREQHGEIDEADLATALRHPIRLVDFEPERLYRILDETADAVMSTLNGGHTFQPSERRILLGNADSPGLLHRWLAMERAQAFSGAPLPAVFELMVNATVDCEGLVIPVRVRIDRIDVDHTQTPAALVVIDYKNSKASIPSKQDVIKGYRQQMPMYVLAVDAECVRLGIDAAVRSAQYMPYGTKLYDKTAAKRVPRLADAAVPMGATENVAKMVFDEDLASAVGAMKHAVGTLLKGDFPVRPRLTSTCERCSYNELCRIQSLGPG
ncbi:MAG: hypothetical protein FGM24_08055 [Candidatus Kapabacteria bacterium]|nr:hypothetical protein [Candidatus Kapabacteria bacterium]